MSRPKRSPYLRQVPSLAADLLVRLKGDKPIVDQRTEARLDREILILKTIIRAEREAFEARTGELVVVDDNACPRPMLEQLLAGRQQTLDFEE